MRAVTFYLDVHVDCARRIVAVDGAVAAICRIIGASDLTSMPARDLAMQSVKVLEFVSQRDPQAVFKASPVTDHLCHATPLLPRICSRGHWWIASSPLRRERGGATHQ